ncbi:membrane protein insertase YidC [Idiomarina tyrosinivorans]|uniref:Membrane protein insertase YidC n=1 Tax=Idiomarina tyrosinivorans TaxID=1445662 RepID=A0A432ZSW4_9GAMM|nr:membrane protein insertase YidC [Idiomarina tyrosinivorans]RUO81025.1 membrane protein insertase YidC [Idiomarina tyrosinivorans]
MNSPRTILLIAFAVVTFYLYNNWVMESAPGTQPAKTEQTTSTNTASTADDEAASVPSNVVSDDGSVPNTQERQLAPQDGVIHVSTDVLDVTIDKRGGDIIAAELNQYAKTQGSKERFQLLHQTPGDIYVAQSGLIGENGIDNQTGRPLYKVNKDKFVMAGDTLSVPMTYTDANGNVFTKIYTFTKGHYDVDVSYEITNTSDQPLNVRFYGQLKQTMGEGSGSMVMPTYRGAAYSYQEDKFEKYDFDDMRDKPLKLNATTGWVGMLEHYFVSAWVPRGTSENTFFTRVVNGDQAIIGMIYPSVTIAPGETNKISSTIFVGPKDQDAMAKVTDYLDLTVDYGFLWWIAQPIFKLMQWLHSFLMNWGLAIIATTIIVKGLLFPLTKAQYESMAKMRLIQPKMKALRERHGSDRQKMSQAMMKLYQEEKVNPLGGCLPMILQLPIFLALYWVFLESVELRHADFFLWINDLSAKDPYYVLPILMGISMFIMQRLQPTPATDPMQQKLFQYMPVIFTVFFLWFPSGLVLYWLVSNLLTITQMTIIYRGLEKKGIMTRKKKKRA